MLTSNINKISYSQPLVSSSAGARYTAKELSAFAPDGGVRHADHKDPNKDRDKKVQKGSGLNYIA